jgi:hypothetical protein
MINSLRRFTLVAVCLLPMSTAALAQSMIHAVSGTVTSISPKIRMIEIATDDGTSGHFQWMSKSDGPIMFDKTVSSDSTAVDKFATKGSHVIVYYFGDGEIRTAVAVRDLGSVPMKLISGKVIKCDRHDHLLTIHNDSGAEVTFHLDPKTVGDTETGVEQGFHFNFDKGTAVRVTATQVDDGVTALLIAPAM